jgi:transcription-repair coupling factor (superfamily II helicase)
MAQLLPKEHLNALANLLDVPRVHSLLGCSIAMLLSLNTKPFVAVTRTEESAERLYDDLLFFRRILGRPNEPSALLMPSGGPDNAGKRAMVAQRLTSEERIFVVTSSDALNEPLHSGNTSMTLMAGDETDRESLDQILRTLGYVKASLVTGPGQYSLRGYILDVFPVADERAFRMEFFGDEIETIREFDLESQRSVEEVDSLTLYPAAEPQEGTTILDRTKWAKPYAIDPVQDEEIDGAIELLTSTIETTGKEAALTPIAGLGVMPQERKDVFALPGVLLTLSKSKTVIVVAASGGQAARMSDLFKEGGVICPLVNLDEAGAYVGKLFMVIGDLSSGLNLEGIILLTERELFGGRPAYKAMKRSRAGALLSSVDDLSAGDYVVHADKGIGRFLGLMHEEIEGAGHDVLAIEYADKAKLFLPIDAIDLLRKYSAQEGAQPRLESLGSKKWQKTRAKIHKKVVELAGKLIKLYASREVEGGVSFSSDNEIHREFASFFPYEETPDQGKAIADIARDMEDKKPMDRLLCGDVGYGKTEVAMRATFKAIYDTRQVAVLVPTTLLCEQHLRVFRQRFSAFPVRIEGLSRFRTAKEKAEIRKRLKLGEIDIVIGTHSLLRKDMEFNDLGLLVVDEEHRFGVRQKERIKELRAGVDVLSMSATPIPRTLQMSLGGLRSMSTMETAPEERIAVRTAVAPFTMALVRDAISRELARGGQVFLVHNRIKDIFKLAAKVQKAVPLARVAVAHGQMKESELEKIMLGFMDGNADVLISTAIISSGIDIPTANTIIIDMADRMGLADLYQLKGRVGRSNVRGYAWFLMPGEAVITEDARQRLEAIQELSYMGAGFRLAMRDLEIRGAGNLLGPQQSGAIESVGFDLYMEMLEAAVAELSGVERKEKLRPVISIKMNAYVPELYIEDMALRLSAYRSINAADKSEELDEIVASMRDRYGPVPDAILNLMAVRKLALLAADVMLAEISETHEGLRYTFAPDLDIKAEALMDLGRKVKFYPDGFSHKVKKDAFAEAWRVLGKLKKAVLN